MVFPDGVAYDREKDDYRTFKVNSVIELIAHQSRLLEDNKKEEADFLTKLPPLVRDPDKISNFVSDLESIFELKYLSRPAGRKSTLAARTLSK